MVSTDSLDKLHLADDADSYHAPMETLSEYAQSVCRIFLNGGPFASGFLCRLPCQNFEVVGLMTNNHVIRQQELLAADDVLIKEIFDNRRNQDTVLFEICFETSSCKDRFQLRRNRDVGRWFASDDVDAAFLELKEGFLRKLVSKNIKPLTLTMIEQPSDIPVAIVYYPRRGPQTAAFSTVSAAQSPSFQNTVTTDYGSSGAPVLDMSTWTVIGIHKAQGERKDKHEKRPVVNWAVNMHAILYGIATKFWAPKLLDGARNGNLNDVQAILGDWPELTDTAKAKTGDKVANVAAICGQLEILRYLVKQNQENVESRGFQGQTPLIQAASNGHLPVVKFLINDASADICAKETIEEENMAIHLAAFSGHIEVVAFLLKKKRDLLENAKNKINIVALHFAAMNDQLKMVEFLVKNKRANVEVRGCEGETPLIFAATAGHLHVVKFLVEEANADIYAKVNGASEPMAIHLAAYFGHIDIVDYLLQREPRLLDDARTKTNDTVLNVAAMNGQLKIVEFLVERANVETRGYQGQTPLIQAAGNGHLGVVKFLIEKAHADIFAKETSEENMAIHLAAKGGHVDVIDYLLQRQPVLLHGLRNKNDDALLNIAARYGQLEVVKFLVKQKRANVEVRGFEGRTPLIHAASTGHLPVVKFLVEEADADMNAKATGGKEWEFIGNSLAIHAAAYFHHNDVVKYLLKKRRDFARSKNAYSLLP